MEVRGELHYTEEHEWILMDGDTATVGITDFAQNKLGDIVYVELPEVGTIIEANEAVGNIESVKAVSEIFCPLAGEVIFINKDLEEEPDLINTSPYDNGWILKLTIEPADLPAANLMNEEQYRAFCTSE